MQGQIALESMPRLGEVLHDNRGLVDVHLAFRQDENGGICITGTYQACLRLICQRCLEPFEWRIAHPINVGVVFDRAEIDRLPDTLEPLLLGEDAVLLSVFIEDEVLLALPLSPVHDERNCVAGKMSKQYGYTRENPFAVLKNLKSINNKRS